ncbi:hypothetical protein [Paenibacillus sp. NPDC058174]|uniref:hypothetical protein n=1 Tax=Paenibacillus sp. NPDC058174 TaxID=3346366 RepID=UPI0036DA6DAA
MLRKRGGVHLCANKMQKCILFQGKWGVSVLQNVKIHFGSPILSQMGENSPFSLHFYILKVKNGGFSLIHLHFCILIGADCGRSRFPYSKSLIGQMKGSMANLL